MRKNLPILSFLLFSATVSVAQTKKPIDSKVALESGIKEYDKGNYKVALSYYNTVPDGDTNYSRVLYEKALTLISDSAYRKAIDVIKDALKRNDVENRALTLYLASAYDYLGKTDSARRIYDGLIELNRNDNQPLYEKGASFMMAEQLDSAIYYFQKSLLINPYHFRSHANLGKVFAKQGRLTEAMIALQASLLMTSDASLAHMSIIIMDDIARQRENVRDAYLKKAEKYSHPLYDEIDQLVNAKIAMNKNYDAGDVLGDDFIIRQLHAIMEKLVYDAEDKGFVMQFYVPIMEEVYKKKEFEDYMILLFSGYNIASIDKLAKRNKGDLEKIKKIVFPYYTDIRAARKLNLAKRKEAPKRYHFYTESNLFIDGVFKDEVKEIFEAGVVSYYKSNVLSAVGSYNANGEKEGEWNYYYYNGAPRLVEHYKNGKLNGKQTGYFISGTVSSVSEYEMGTKKTRSEYNYKGTPKNKADYQNEKDNTYTSYFPNGAVEYSFHQHDENITDKKLLIYTKEGKLYQDISFKQGKKDGPYKSYYDNGKVKTEMSYLAGKEEGEYTSYYESGKVNIKCSYKEGKLDGNYEEYREDGKIERKCFYVKDKLNGDEIYYRKDGTEFFKVVYKSDIPNLAVFTDKEGKTREQKLSKSGAVMKVPYEDGSLHSEIPYESGKIEGAYKIYYRTGQLHKEITYKEGQLDGEYTTFYKNGNKSEEDNYTGGTLNGLYTAYYENGEKSVEGWYIDGEKEGIWKSYYANGVVKDEYYNAGGRLNGPDKYYNENGSPDYTAWYDMNVMYGEDQFDSTGKMIFSETYPQGNGTCTAKYRDGKPYFQIPVKYGSFDGAYHKWFPDGSVLETGANSFGRADGVYTSYYPNGMKLSTGQYVNTETNGDVTFYEADGSLSYVAPYKDGEIEGVEKTYRMGVLRYATGYKAGEKDGNLTIYGEDNKVAGILVFEDGHLVGYTYEGKDGKLLPVIPVALGTAKINTFYANGAKGVVYNFEKDCYEGKQQLFYSNGQLAEEKTFVKNNYEGSIKRYYKDGKPAYTASYKNDMQQGVETYYAADGSTLLSCNYKDNAVHGNYTIKDKTTGKMVKLQYYYGYPVSIKP